jgi:hypothetical protein
MTLQTDLNNNHTWQKRLLVIVHSETVSLPRPIDMNHHTQNIIPIKPDYKVVTLKLKMAAEHWVTICAAYVTNWSVSWRR